MTITSPITSPKAENKSPAMVAVAAKKKGAGGGGGGAKPKAAGSATGATRKKRRSKHSSYATFVHRVLKQVHPEAGISKKGMAVMDDMMKHLFERLATEAKSLQSIQQQSKKRTTFTTKDVQSAVALVLPGELSKHAFSEGHKAVTLFMNNTQKPKKPKQE